MAIKIISALGCALLLGIVLYLGFAGFDVTSDMVQKQLPIDKAR